MHTTFLWRTLVRGATVACLSPIAANAASRPQGLAEDQNTVSPGMPFTATVPISPQFATAGAVPPPDPAVGGSWQLLSYPSPVRSIHAVLLNNGKVLLSAGSGNSPKNFTAGSFTAAVWNPADDSFAQLPLPWDMFCSGHSVLPDGRVFIAGGTTAYQTPATAFEGSNRSYIFNPVDNSFTRGPDMLVGRWYPTAVELGNGNIATIAGFDAAGLPSRTPELYQSAAGTFVRLPSRSFSNYPNMVLTADGRLFYSGQKTGDPSPAPGIWDLVTNSYQKVPGLTHRIQRGEGATVLLPPAQNQVVLTMGGGTPGIADTAIVDLKAANPVYIKGQPLRVPKMYVSASILPNSTVFESGGGTNRDIPVYEASVFEPGINSFVPMAAPTVGRTYHSESVLLPDGRVAMFGGNPGNAPFEMRIEIFSPPYLYQGIRPTITAAPTEIGYGGQYTINAAAAGGSSVTSAVLIRPSAVTHSTDPDQRLVDLAATPVVGGLSINVPASGNLAPPGWYMLFVNDSLGRPSVASWVHLS